MSGPLSITLSSAPGGAFRIHRAGGAGLELRLGAGERDGGHFSEFAHLLDVPLGDGFAGLPKLVRGVLQRIDADIFHRSFGIHGVRLLCHQRGHAFP